MPENKAYQEGYDAYFAGADPEENPYHYGTTADSPVDGCGGGKKAEF